MKSSLKISFPSRSASNYIYSSKLINSDLQKAFPNSPENRINMNQTTQPSSSNLSESGAVSCDDDQVSNGIEQHEPVTDDEKKKSHHKTSINWATIRSVILPCFHLCNSSKGFFFLLYFILFKNVVNILNLITIFTIILFSTFIEFFS